MKKEEERKGLELKTSVPLCIAIAPDRKTRSFLTLLAVIHYICILPNLVVGNLCITFM